MDSVALARSLGIAATLRAQQGLIRRDQALALGFSSASISSEVRAARWRRVLPRVYAVEIGPLPPALRVRATWLWAGDDSTIAGSAAAWWASLHTAFPTMVDVVVPPGKRMSGQPGVRVIRARLHERDRVSRDGICVTAIHRTCLDLVRAGRDEILEDALRRRRIRLDELPGSLARSWHRRGQVRARRAVEDVSAAPWSRPERRVHQLLRDAGIAGWVANRRTPLATGPVHPDIEFDEVMLGIEIDGRGHHDPALDAQAFEDDHERELALIAAGWTVLRFTVRQIVEQPAMFIRMVRDMLDRLRARQPRSIAP